MATTTLHIRNMVCNRCILVVQQLLEGLGLTPLHIELGKAIVQEELPPEAKAALKTALEAVGFELIDGRRSLLIERLRNAVIELAHYHDDGMRTNLSDYLSEKFHSDYSALSKLFSEMTGITLENITLHSGSNGSRNCWYTMNCPSARSPTNSTIRARRT